MKFKIFKKYVASFFLLLMISCAENLKKVPVISNSFNNQKNEIDSLKFRNQFNEVFPINSLKGKVHLVNFFFTTCKTICPLMEVPLNEIAEKHKNLHLISFTIDPKNDSIPVLKAYYNLTNKTNRTFLIGVKKDLQKISKLYLSTIDNNNDENLFHTSYVVLLDKKMQLRGLYNSLDKNDLLFLEEDISVLLEE